MLGGTRTRYLFDNNANGLTTELKDPAQLFKGWITLTDMQWISVDKTYAYKTCSDIPPPPPPPPLCWSRILIISHCAGHSGPVRSVYVQDSEHCFLSASKDKTVKLWSLSNHGDGTAQSASSWTYYRHTRPVFHVGMVESVRQAVSCDGSLHVSYHIVLLMCNTVTEFR